MDVPDTTMDGIHEIGTRTVIVIAIKTVTIKGTVNEKKVVSSM
jgi:hypothetical protein